ncbi:unnamed protein product [Meloidogyne enterolobii]|uniref:Uncharacterized protein n=1 Tax=Meloidogyne enterolobii TaxID=390850 RepID=A0ACB0ZEI4_MELEN
MNLFNKIIFIFILFFNLIFLVTTTTGSLPSSHHSTINLSKRDNHLVLLGPGSCEKTCNQRYKGKEFTKCMKQVCGYP